MIKYFVLFIFTTTVIIGCGAAPTAPESFPTPAASEKKSRKKRKKKQAPHKGNIPKSHFSEQDETSAGAKS